MSPEKIKDKLYEKRITRAEIAKRCRVSWTAVDLVVRGVTTSAKIEKAIARAIGVTRDELRGAA